MRAGLSSRIIRSASLLVGLTSVSRVLGYVRDMLSAAIFGAGWVADAYFVAFRIPNMLRDLVGEGALSASVIPTVSRLDAKHGPRQAHRLIAALVSSVFLWGGVLIVAGVFAAPLIVSVIAPGFRFHPEKFGLTVSLTRMLFPFIVLVSLAAVMQGLLNARSRFGPPALGPIALNVCIIAAALVLVPLLGVAPEKRIYGWAAGVLLGGAAQWLVQVPAARSLGFRFSFRLAHPALRDVGLLMIPAMIGLSVSQLHVLVNTILASLLPEGSVAYLYYGNRLQQLPLGVIGVAIATASYPIVSAALARGNPARAAQAVNQGLRLAAFAVLPAAAGLFVLAPHITGLLFRYGRFDASDAAVTASVCAAYAVGIVGHAWMRILTPPFYALGRPYQPVAVVGAAVAGNALLASLLMMKFGVAGLPAATSMVTLLSSVWLLKRLRVFLPGVGGARVTWSFVRSMGMAAVMGVLVWAAARAGEAWLIDSDTGLKVRELVLTAGGIATGVILYASLALVSGARELGEILQARKRER